MSSAATLTDTLDAIKAKLGSQDRSLQGVALWMESIEARLKDVADRLGPPPFMCAWCGRESAQGARCEVDGVGLTCQACAHGYWPSSADSGPVSP